MKKPTKTFTKSTVKQLAGAQLGAVTGGFDPAKRKEIIGTGGTSTP